ncbi:MAG: lactonase family protein [Candidatus Brocadiia bacterium]
MADSGGKTIAYVGSYSDESARGIHAFEFDVATGRLERLGGAGGVTNPSFLALHPGGRFLYAVNETGQFAGEGSGAVAAFSIDPASGGLTLLNRQATGGPGPCHLTVDATGRCVLAANYRGGSVCVVPIEADGRLGERTDFVQHQGSSVHPTRQTGPHAHSVTLDPTNTFACVADLGVDRVVIYRLDPENGRLSPNADPWYQARRGAGPRHFAFGRNGWFAYLINELDSTVTVLRCDRTRGGLEQVQTISALPGDFEGESTAADIHVHPSGRFVYGSNRGHDSIAVFAVNRETGRLRLVGHESTRGETPRGFALDPTGEWLVAANQNSDNIVVFRIDTETGRLTPTGHEVEVSSPTCVKFLSLNP